ncbi:MAG TPA: RluA family pseudouridine synthase [Candidatus Baltobacteraceae bacterium]|nr:RluA family pseudouridine synthase [Candidatus Baltobacteraceae bacterium]
MLHAVTADEAGKRADVVVARLSGAPRSLVADAVKHGTVRVNGETAKASRLLQDGDVLEFEVARPPALVALPEAIEIPIVYEDEDLVVVDKPAGMVTHPARSATSGTLINALLAHTGGELPGDVLRPGLVHRLDRDTSGLLVVAKNAATLSALGIAMKARRIKREYLGLVRGIPEHARGTVEGPIGRDPHNRLKFAIVGDGKPAVTHYEVREAFEKSAELIFRLQTGRTHQIRVHMAAMGHPVLNDPVYGRTEPGWDLPGQALHAWRLEFVHPRSGEELRFEVDPPPEYARAREMLRVHAHRD